MDGLWRRGRKEEGLLRQGRDDGPVAYRGLSVLILTQVLGVLALKLEISVPRAV